MPRKKPAPECFETDEASKMIRCLICKENDTVQQGTWIKHGSASQHIETNAHKLAVARREQLLQVQQEEERRLQEIYGGNTIPLSGNAQLYPTYPRANMYGNQDAVDTDMDNQNSPPQAYMLCDADIPDLGIKPIERPDPSQERERLRQQVEQLLLQAEHEDEFGSPDDPDDLTSTNIAQAFADLDLEEMLDEEEVFDYFNQVSPEHDYYPYPNKTTMLLDILDNLPRLRMSSNQLRLILWLLKQTGVSNVPSFSGFRNMQTHLRNMCGTTPKQHVSSLGNIFYSNNIGESVMRDFANPEVAKHLHLYPEETEGPISEVWQAERWKEFAPSELTPMFSQGHRQFFIDEVAQLQDGQYVIPRNWVMRKGKLTSDCHIVTVNPVRFSKLHGSLVLVLKQCFQSGWTLLSETQIFHADDFQFNYFDVVSRIRGPISWSEGTEVPAMPNNLRELAGDDDLVVIMVPLWCDDVSGNKSKQYNKHINVYMANSNIPGRLLQQEYFVRFVSTSPNATSPEQFSALKDQINETQKKPIQCYNAHTNKKTRAILRVPGLPADNPQQSEESCHMGGNANCKCRKCHVGGPHEKKESNEGYHEHYLTGIKRSAEETRLELEKQIKLAMYGVEKPINETQTNTGTKDKVAQHWIDILLAKSRELKSANPSRSVEEIAQELQTWFDEQPGDKINPLLSIAGLDPTQDTPVEILHTILLGIVKYAWHHLHSNWTEAEQNLFTVRLQSTDIDGLSVPPIRVAYMMQYRNGLIGKHFKTLMQTLPFHVHGTVSDAQFKLVKAIGELGSVLWVHEIGDMEKYLSDLEILIGNVLDAFAEIDPSTAMYARFIYEPMPVPSKIIVKLKLHMLPHLIEDIKRFGPAIRNSTEVFECFNAIFRLCSILSNHQAASRDIALKFASMDRLKHMLSGGYWLSEVEEGKFEWIRAGENVRNILQSEPTIQRHLGWAPSAKFQSGRKRTPPTSWENTKASQFMDSEETAAIGFPNPRLLSWRKGVTTTAQSGDRCSTGSWVVARNHKVCYILASHYCSIAKNDQGESCIGRIHEIIGPDEKSASSTGIITLECFQLGKEHHPDFGLPTLQRPQADLPKYILKAWQDPLFIFSAHHDCHTASCQATALQPQLQERQLTSRMNKLIAHNDSDHFIINLYGLHNAILLREFLPRELTAPQPLHQDRKAFHYEVAAKLRVQQAEKRAKTNARRKATRAANKAKQVERQKQNPDHEQESEQEMDERPNSENGSDIELGGDDDIEVETRRKRRRN
ncbi:hypothetical protein GALMADRAFT_99137 [Galerina marginata CBS 339.88]|uniref:Uncharacterized protein n=1 Tax=Galerina marginata (strain CBS 339.88) TaxID=685588 RepID=A0A067SXV5_GALM3|nr:hypothetical protein GALMADRAFT_99137 [Galerina marginata CBS 339.88]